MISSDYRKKMADSWFSYLQIQICKSFELLEKNKSKFSKRDWFKKLGQFDAISNYAPFR